MNKERKKTEVLQSFTAENYHGLCDRLGNLDKDLQDIIHRHGYPPMWTRKNNFETIVRIILEQQVSLASALAHLNKLKEKVGRITPAAVLQLNDEQMRDCFISRQKTAYLRGVANAIISKALDLKSLESMSNDEIRNTLIKLKGIGQWTIDVYLMFVLQRIDVLPIGDLAIVSAIKKLKRLHPKATREEMLEIAAGWAPYRTVASMLLWHFYLSGNKSK